MKKAFTMIELIFVIVILGVLSAIAIPKLSATRDDAVNVGLAQNIMTGAGEIASYAIAHGETTDDLSIMSHAITLMVTSHQATLNSTEHRVDIIRGGVNDCVMIDVDVGTNDENLTVALGNAAGDKDCLGLQAMIDMTIYPMVLRGTRVVQ